MSRRKILILSAALAACSGGSGPTAIEISIARIEIASNECVSVVEGGTCVIVAHAFGTDGMRIGNPVLRWFSDSSAVATVQNGVVTARSPGTATIAVTNSTASVITQVVVRVLPQSNR